MRKIGKKKVVNVIEIEEELRKNSPELAEFFIETCKKINNPLLVKTFWNCLVKFTKLDKHELADDLLQSAVLSLGTANILNANGNPIAASVANLTTIGLLAGTFAADYVAGTPAGKVYAELENMLISEPELYDIELCFNGYTREDIDTSEYDGKATYQRLHDQYEKEGNLKTSLQKDLEPSDNSKEEFDII